MQRKAIRALQRNVKRYCNPFTRCIFNQNQILILFPRSELQKQVAKTNFERTLMWRTWAQWRDALQLRRQDEIVEMLNDQRTLAQVVERWRR